MIHVPSAQIQFTQTDYAVAVFHEAFRTGQYECYLQPDTRLPMMYIDDCLQYVLNMHTNNLPIECRPVQKVEHRMPHRSIHAIILSYLTKRRSLLQFMTTPSEQLKRRVYNVTAMSFTPEELFAKLAKHLPELRITYKPDSRQSIGMKQNGTYCTRNWHSVKFIFLL